MASIPEDPRKASQTTAKGATTTTSMAGAGASAAAKTAAKPAAGAATPAAPSEARAATTPPNKNDPQTDAPPDWDALRAEVIKNSPKVKVVQITGPIDMLKVLIANRDEQASTTYTAHPRKSASQDNNKNNRTVPLPKL